MSGVIYRFCLSPTYTPIGGLGFGLGGSCLTQSATDDDDATDSLPQSIALGGINSKSITAYYGQSPFILGGVSVQLDGEDKELTIDLQAFSSSYEVRYSCHKGLILSLPGYSSFDQNYIVSNPATKQILRIPANPSPSSMIILGGGGEAQQYEYNSHAYCAHTIVNLSQHRNEHVCPFIIIRFGKSKLSFEVYYSHLKIWVRSTHYIDKSPGYLISTKPIFLDNTLYLPSDSTSILGIRFIRFQSEFADQMTDAFIFRKPYITIMNQPYDGVMGVSCDMGLFYAYKDKHVHLWVWKLHHNTREWVQVVHVNLNTEWFKFHHLHFDDDPHPLLLTSIPLLFHQDHPIVLVKISNSIYAYNIVSHTLKKMAVAKDSCIDDARYTSPFSPCLVPIE